MLPIIFIIAIVWLSLNSEDKEENQELYLDKNGRMVTIVMLKLHDYIKRSAQSGYLSDAWSELDRFETMYGRNEWYLELHILLIEKTFKHEI